ncbi:lipopolysaccharide biosynthesis protein [Qipengyuania citrea]|uniref:lipopolysaccharide biosynthesis protein n=1 Tax=Qipengyuania citrea TaxID=225971 RepID=UPI00329A5982
MVTSQPPDPGKIAFVDQRKVGGRARSGALWSAAQILLRNGLALVITAILARILSPQDYGLVGMVATLTALLQVFANMGLSWATVRSAELNQKQVSGLFWINLGVGLLAWGGMVAAAPLIAQFYDEPALKLIAIVSGTSFVFAGATVQPIALMTRSMDFRRISMIEVLALLSGASVSLFMAFTGAGYWALVAQAPVQAAVRLALCIRPSAISISAPRWVPGLGAMISFGSLLVATEFLIFLARNLDGILIGKYWGATELGYYNRAYFLMLLPSMLASGVLSQVMVSSLSSLQHDLDRLANAYRRALCMVAYVGTPIALGLGLSASVVVPLVYGPGWDKVVVLLEWLSIAGVTQPIFLTYGWLFTATGRVRTYLWVTLINSIILGTVFYLTVPQGTIAIAKGYGLVMGLVLPLPVLWIAHRKSGIPFLLSLKYLAPIFILNAIMGTVVIITSAIFDDFLSNISVFLIQVTFAIITYISLTPFLLPSILHNDAKNFIKKLNPKNLSIEKS